MPFAIRCPGCNAVLKAPDKAAGRTLACPGCKRPVTFPKTPPEPAKADPKPAALRLDPPPAMPDLSLDAPPAAPPKPPAPAPSGRGLDELDFDNIGLVGDDGPKPAAPAPPTPPPKPAAKPSAAPPAEKSALDFDLDSMPGLVADAAAPAAPPPPRPAAPDLSLDDSKPAVPDLSLDDEPDEIEEIEEAEDDFELVEDEPDAADLDEVVAVDEEVLDEVIPVEDEPEPAEPKRKVPAWMADSRLLGLRLVHVRAQKVGFVETMARMDNAGHDLVDPKSKRKVGQAVEVRDGAQQAIRYLVGRTVMETRVEIRERGELLAVIRRPPYLWESSLEILDPDDRVLGVFERTPFSALTQKPVWIKSRRGAKLLQMLPQPGRGKMVLMGREGTPLGEMLTESAYEKKLKIYWMTRGCGYYVRFTSELDDRPEDKLRFLAAVVGLDLFMWEHVR